MGFSVLGSLGCSHVLVRNSCHGSVKFQALSGKERFGGGAGDFVSFSKLKTWTGRALACNKSEFVVDFEDRTSPHEVRKEIERCYELIHRLGRGVVYLGSSRMGLEPPHHLQSLELGREARHISFYTVVYPMPEIFHSKFEPNFWTVPRGRGLVLG